MTNTPTKNRNRLNPTRALLSGLLLTLLSLPVAAQADTGGIIRINAGGPEVTLQGVTWQADRDFESGMTYRNPTLSEVANTRDTPLYLTERSSDSDQGTFGYRIPLPNGRYQVRLHFAEIYWGAAGGAEGGPGDRVFSVAVEGQGVIRDLDLNAVVGSATALLRTVETVVTDGVLELTFSASLNRPKLSALEVLPLQRATGQATLTLRAVPSDATLSVFGPDGYSERVTGGRVGNLAAGTYVITGTRSGFEVDWQRVTLTGADGAQVTLTLTPLPVQPTRQRLGSRGYTELQRQRAALQAQTQRLIALPSAESRAEPRPPTVQSLDNMAYPYHTLQQYIVQLQARYHR